MLGYTNLLNLKTWSIAEDGVGTGGGDILTLLCCRARLVE